ncbi:galactose mutarotase [Nocardioides panacisoli]|uniref:Galactose mutarotase n=1 Tax=Nocardioides panacisoli TaxID=627624 RepID=A0ABP7HYK3_9ACTN
MLTYGARLQSLVVPDRDGRAGDVLLALPDLAAYESDETYTGATVGRFANRIAHGRFVLDGHEHRVPVNDRGHALHGGPGGFHQRVWSAEPVGGGVRLSLASPGGEMGFPAGLVATTTITVAGEEVAIEHGATADAPTVVSLTQHPYFALGGPVADQRLQVAASRYLPVDDGSIPLGDLAPVEGTGFDVRAETEVDGSTYDHCWVLDDPGAGPAARLSDPASGRVVELSTDRPGLQVYTGDALPAPRTGLALEAQAFPDTPNHPEWPTYGDSVLRPGETWSAVTRWRFTTDA